MKKKVFAILLAMVMVLSISSAALADDGTAADGPKDSGTANESTGAATVTHDGANFLTENDDDAVAKAAETTADGTDISVWAKIAENGGTSATVVYKIDVTWGAMKFEFNRGAGTWNPETHTYDGGAEGAAWTTEGFVNGTNNKITVTNHTNSAIDATFAVNLGTAFNPEAGADAVVANFFDDNTKAITAAGVLTAVANVADTLTASKISLPTAAGTELGSAPSDDVFVALSGTPGETITMADFTKAGTITVTFAVA